MLKLRQRSPSHRDTTLQAEPDFTDLADATVFAQRKTWGDNWTWHRLLASVRSWRGMPDAQQVHQLYVMTLAAGSSTFNPVACTPGVEILDGKFYDTRLQALKTVFEKRMGMLYADRACALTRRAMVQKLEFILHHINRITHN